MTATHDSYSCICCIYNSCSSANYCDSFSIFSIGYLYTSSSSSNCSTL
jgi:hypothetical protein